MEPQITPNTQMDTGEHRVDRLPKHIIGWRLTLQGTGLHRCLQRYCGKPRVALQGVVLALSGAAALCVFCVICGSILPAIGKLRCARPRHGADGRLERAQRCLLDHR
jgi:hypothetical protein